MARDALFSRIRAKIGDAPPGYTSISHQRAAYRIGVPWQWGAFLHTRKR